MKKIFHILTAALLLTGALLTTACTNEEEAAVNINNAQTVTFTATLAPKGDNGGQTRVITTGTEGGKEVLTTAWTVNEHIAVYYQKNNDSYATVMATVGEPNSDGSVPISATLTDAKNGTTVKLVYPYTLHDNAGGIKTSKFTGQKGTLADISSNFDAATATGTIAVSGGSASINGKLTMQNQVCICKFKFQNIANKNDGANYYDVRVTVKKDDTTRSFQASNIPKASMEEVYMAILGTTDSECKFVVTGWDKTSPDDQDAIQKGSYNCTYNNVTLVAGKFYRNVPVTLSTNDLTPQTGNVSLTTETGELLLGDGATVTGTGGENTILKIVDGATVTLNGVTNTGITQDADIPGIECEGDATIILEGENSVRGREYAPGIFIPKYHTLTIQGSGTLHATGGNTSYTGAGSATIGGAGIGGTKNTSCGNIRIEGGTITATGTGWCAGIGSGWAYEANITCGAITITGGTVMATGGSEAAGIGSGYAFDDDISCGAITISGGTVTATGGQFAAGIGSGSGNDFEDFNHIHHYYASSCGAISITGGTVEATSGDRGAGIGSGSYGMFTSISIGSGITSVTATRNNDFANVPIGQGYNDQGSGAVTFGGVTLTDDQTKGTADLPTFPNLQVVKSDGGGITNNTWTLTPAP